MAKSKGRGRGRRSKKLKENGTAEAAGAPVSRHQPAAREPEVTEAGDDESPEALERRRQHAVKESRRAYYRMLSEVATSMWYLKTKHFRKAWDDDDPELEDRRERRALGRLAKGIEALKEAGVEVHDPTNERYPSGGEATMKPIQLDPTPGIGFATVTETVRPVVYLRQTRIQRGEVFVAVPLEGDGVPAPSSSENESPPDTDIDSESTAEN